MAGGKGKWTVLSLHRSMGTLASKDGVVVLLVLQTRGSYGASIERGGGVLLKWMDDTTSSSTFKRWMKKTKKTEKTEKND